MRYKITIYRWSGDREVEKCNWKDLISALVLCGYEVYGDEDNIVFELGADDIMEEIKEEEDVESNISF